MNLVDPCGSRHEAGVPARLAVIDRAQTHAALATNADGALTVPRAWWQEARMMALRLVVRAMAALAGSALLAGCHGARPAALGVRQGRLAPCPSSPNCVSSQAGDEAHRVAPIPCTGRAGAAISRLTEIVRALPRASVITSTEDYLHAEFRSAVFGFVDDVEFLADEPAGVVHLRSASRVGSWDLGVNRRRIEAIRALWSGSPSR